MFVQAEVGIGDGTVTGVQTCALPICTRLSTRDAPGQLAAEAVVVVVARVESRVPVPAEPRLQLHVARIDARARRERLADLIARILDTEQQRLAACQAERPLPVDLDTLAGVESLGSLRLQ